MPQVAIEEAIGQDRFSMRSLHENLWPLLGERTGASDALASIRARFSAAHLKKLEYALIRHVFLAERSEEHTSELQSH